METITFNVALTAPDLHDRVYLSRTVRTAVLRALRHNPAHLVTRISPDPTGFATATRDEAPEPTPQVEITILTDDPANATTLLHEALGGRTGIMLPDIGPIPA